MCVCVCALVLNDIFAQIEEVALVTDKGSSRRRGFIFVTYLTEDSVDKCTEIPFHVVGESRVRQRHMSVQSVYLSCCVFALGGGEKSDPQGTISRGAREGGQGGRGAVAGRETGAWRRRRWWGIWRRIWKRCV